MYEQFSEINIKRALWAEKMLPPRGKIMPEKG